MLPPERFPGYTTGNNNKHTNRGCAYEDVFEADVAVRDVEMVQILNGVQQVAHDAAGTQLRVAELLSQHDRVIHVPALQTVGR